MEHMELFTERSLLKDVLPDKAKDIAKKYKLKEDEIEFVRKNIPLKAEDLTIEDGERAAIRFVNTADIDRDNEIVLPSGIQLNDFKKSPTVLYGHNYQGLPIGKDIWIKNVPGKGILAKTVYAKHQLAEDVYNLVKEKFLNTSSIGFIPLESVSPDKKGWDKLKAKLMEEYALDEKLIDSTKRVYTKSILLEHSDVPIPSNINALNIAVGKGLEIKSQELIDDLKLEIIDEKDEKDVNEIIDEIEDEVKEVEKEAVTKTNETEKEEPNKGFSLDEMIEQLKFYPEIKFFVVDKKIEEEDEDIKINQVQTETDLALLAKIYKVTKWNKELAKRLEEIELKAGAVLNKKNKADLGNAQKLIQNVLDSAETSEPVATTEEGKEVDVIEIEDEKESEIEEKDNQEEKDTIDIDEIKDILKNYIKKTEDDNEKYKKEQYAQLNKIGQDMPEMLFKIKTGKVI